MDGALEYYRNSSLFSRTRDMLNAPVQRIDEILSLPYSINDFKDVELPANDDDSWMYNGEGELNLAISERQKEMETYASEKRRDKRQNNGTTNNSGSQSNDFNLGDIAETMQAFVSKLSSFEGAEVPEDRNTKEVQLDVDQFMKEMESVLGNEGPLADDDFEGHSSSSEMNFGDSEDESDLDGNEDNGINDTFMHSYSDALNEELNASTLKRSFMRVDQQLHNDGEGTSKVENDEDEELTPVDVDLNLVKSFLDSFSSQQGLPGPASNLLGLMGLEIPPEAKK